MAVMIPEEALEVKQAWLDLYFVWPRGKTLRDTWLGELFEEKQQDKDDIPFAWELGKIWAGPWMAREPARLVDEIRARVSDYRRNAFGHRDLSVVEAGHRLSDRPNAPFAIAHFWFRLGHPKMGKPGTLNPEDFAIPAAQNIYYGFKEAIHEDCSGPSCSNVTMLVDVGAPHFKEIRGSWERIVGWGDIEPVGSNEIKSPFDLMPNSWRLHSQLSISQMSTGTNRHVLLGLVHRSRGPMAASYTVVFQDGESPVYQPDQPLHVGFHIDSIGGGSMGGRRAQYYEPRSETLGAILLLDGWVRERATRVDSLQLECAKHLSRASVQQGSLLSLAEIGSRIRGHAKNDHQARDLVSRIAKMRQELDTATVWAGSQLEQLVQGNSIWDGVEAPFYLYPRSEFGNQSTAQDGIV